MVKFEHKFDSKISDAANKQALKNLWWLLVLFVSHYFLYINRAQMHVIPKNSIVEGDFSELDMMLTEKLGEKFKKGSEVKTASDF